MGKRKPRRRTVTKPPAPKLDSEFDCPFCSALKSVQVQIKRREHIAQLFCRACNVEYQTSVSPLDESVDVFSQWIDSCEEINSPSGRASGSMFIPQREVARQQQLPPQRETAPPPNKRRRIQGGAVDDEDEEDAMPTDVPVRQDEDDEFPELPPDLDEDALDVDEDDEGGDTGDEIEIDNYQAEDDEPAPGPTRRGLQWDAGDD